MKMRNKLMAASLMLVVSILMMSTASFAWFTISTAPEVTGITATAATNENLEIALANGTTLPSSNVNDGEFSGNNYAWGSLVALAGSTSLTGSSSGTNEYTAFLADSDSNATGSQAVTLRPMELKADGSGFTAPIYGLDGRISDMDGVALTTSTNTNGFGTIYDAEERHIYGYYVDFWIRTNMSGNLDLATADTLRAGGMEETKGAGSTVVATATTKGNSDKEFEDNLKIAVQKLGSQTYGGSYVAETTPATIVGTTNTADTQNIVGTANTLAVVGSNGFFSMEKDTAYLIRVYVYVDGNGVSNAMGYATNAAAITAALNVQFTVNGVDQPMDVPPATGYGS